MFSRSRHEDRHDSREDKHRDRDRDRDDKEKKDNGVEIPTVLEGETVGNKITGLSADKIKVCFLVFFIASHCISG